jgi:hypothetical protein
MKPILENWRKFLNEEVKLQGILKLTPTPEVVAQAKDIMQTLPPEAVPLPDERLHVTLAHQSVLKPFRKQLKTMELPEPPEAILATDWEEKVDEELGRKSWFVELVNQDDMRAYINHIMELVGGALDPEPNRRFHVSLANLTGNPGDSVR